MTILKLSIPVNFDLSFLKIRWSDHLLLKEDKKTVGEGVVYGGNWEKAERLARQMAETKFGASRGDLTVCEQVFIGKISNFKFQISDIRLRGSNLKIKVGRNVFEDIKTLIYLKNVLKFPNKIRIDANQGYSLKQLQYIIPTLKEIGVEYVEEPVKKENLEEAIEILHRNGLKIILDETLNNINIIKVIKIIDAINIKLSRIGNINEAIHSIKLCKKNGQKVIIGCSEELERGMEAIYALGQIAKRRGVLLEIEGFGPLRLAPFAQTKHLGILRWFNRLENINLILRHTIRQISFDLWWRGLRVIVLAIKKTKLLSALSLRLVRITGKNKYSIHPKHLIENTSQADFLKYIRREDVVLDVGCGNGQNAIKAAGIAARVIGFDVDDKMLDIAKQVAKTTKIAGTLEFKKASAEKVFKYKNKAFDKVLLLGVLEHLINREAVLREIYRVLKHGGKLILGIPNANTSWKILQRRFGVNSVTDPDHKIEYTKPQIEKILMMNNFRIEKILATAYDTPWAGIIDVAGGISLGLYEKLLKWKWRIAKECPEEGISYLVVVQKV